MISPGVPYTKHGASPAVNLFHSNPGIDIASNIPPLADPFAQTFLGYNSIHDKADVWNSELNADPDRTFLLDGIQNGFKITSISDPANVTSAKVPNHASALKHSHLVEKDLLYQLSVGQYVRSDRAPQIVSALGAIPKDPSSHEVRVIHDASRPVGQAINDYATLTTVKYQTLDEAYNLAKPTFYMAKVDLKSAYRSVPIHPSDYCLTGLEWHFEGEEQPAYLFDCRLPFGASLAPSIFNRLTQAVRRMMAKRGFPRLVVYLDDFLCIEDSYERCALAQQTLLSLLIKLGFLISWHKVIGPTQRLTFLGIVINTVECTLSLDQAKVEALQEKLVKFDNRKRASKRQLQCLAGSLNWACQAVRGGRFFLRRIIDTMNGLRRPCHKYKLSAAFRLDIKWWLNFLEVFNGVVYYREAEKAVVMTDACTIGCGMYHCGDWHYVNWEVDAPQFQNLHINYKEVLAVTLAAKRWAPRWTNRDVTLITDSIVAKSIINKGTTKNPVIMQELRDLYWLMVQYNFTLKAIHCPGCIHVLPDAISRLHEPGQTFVIRSLLQFYNHSCSNYADIDWPDHMSTATFQKMQHILPPRQANSGGNYN